MGLVRLKASGWFTVSEKRPLFPGTIDGVEKSSRNLLTNLGSSMDWPWTIVKSKDRARAAVKAWMNLMVYAIQPGIKRFWNGIYFRPM